MRWAEVRNALAIILIASGMLAVAVGMFDPADASRVCGRGGCSSGAALGLFAVLVSGGGVLAGLLTLARALGWVPGGKPRSPYGSRAEHENRLRSMGVSEEQIRSELDKYRRWP